jgi:hypothetical protein
VTTLLPKRNEDRCRHKNRDLKKRRDFLVLFVWVFCFVLFGGPRVWIREGLMLARYFGYRWLSLNLNPLIRAVLSTGWQVHTTTPSHLLIWFLLNLFPPGCPWTVILLLSTSQIARTWLGRFILNSQNMGKSQKYYTEQKKQDTSDCKVWFIMWNSRRHS